jgi:antitoxin CptB
LARTWLQHSSIAANAARETLTFAFPAAISPSPGTSGLFVLQTFVLAKHMSGTTISSDGLDARRRRLLFRAWHRGMREVDLITGRFADAHIGTLSESEVDEFERLMEVPEPELLAWVMGAETIPARYDTMLFRKMRDFYGAA